MARTKSDKTKAVCVQTKKKRSSSTRINNLNFIARRSSRLSNGIDTTMVNNDPSVTNESIVSSHADQNPSNAADSNSPLLNVDMLIDNYVVSSSADSMKTKKNPPVRETISSVKTSTKKKKNVDRLSKLKAYEEKKLAEYDEQIFAIREEIKNLQSRLEQLISNREEFRSKIRQEVNEI